MAIIEDDVAGPIFKELRAPMFSFTRTPRVRRPDVWQKMALVIDGGDHSEWDVKGTGEPVFSRTADGLRDAGTSSGGFLRKRSLYTVA